MPKLLSLETETDIKRLSKEKYSHRQIKKKLKEENIDVSIRKIIRVLKNEGLRRKALAEKKPIPKFQRTPTKRTKLSIGKVKSLINKENPTSFRNIKPQTSLSLGTIFKIIHSDLQMKSVKKGKVHRLSSKTHVCGTISPFLT